MHASQDMLLIQLIWVPIQQEEMVVKLHYVQKLITVQLQTLWLTDVKLAKHHLEQFQLHITPLQMHNLQNVLLLKLITASLLMVLMFVQFANLDISWIMIINVKFYPFLIVLYKLVNLITVIPAFRLQTMYHKIPLGNIMHLIIMEEWTDAKLVIQGMLEYKEVLIIFALVVHILRETLT